MSFSPPPLPSFSYTSEASSPTDSGSQPLTPSSSTENFSGAEFISSQYLPPWAAPLSNSIDQDFASNAPTTPPPRARPVVPRRMEPVYQSTLFSGNNEKTKESPKVGNAWFDVPKLNLPEGEMTEECRIIRGRALRVNTLHQRAYYNDDLSPLYPPDKSSTRPEYSPSSENTSEKKFLLVEETDLAPSPSKTRFQRTSSNNRLKIFYPSALLKRFRALPDSPGVWLALYFTLNLTLTLYNKSVLIHFPFPYTLTALHALCGTIGTSVLLRMGGRASDPRLAGARPLTGVSSLTESTPMPNLNGRQLIALFLFSILYTLNIVVSNASLRLVTVPFHQVVRASAPFFTIMFAALILRRGCSKNKLLSLIPVVAGVGFATYGDYYFTATGFFLTLLGTLLAALKTILTNVILVKPTASTLPVSTEASPMSEEAPTKHSTYPPSFFSSLIALAVNHLSPSLPSSSPAYPIKPLANAAPLPTFAFPKLSLSPIHLLYLMSPLAFIQTTLLAHFTGELDRVRWHLFNPTALGASNGRMWLLLNGVLAFFLNVVSFNANRRIGPLGMSVAANVKQVLTILCAVAIFDLTITPANGLGIFLTLVGGALYAAVELREKEDSKRTG